MDDPNNPVDISNYKNDEIHKLMEERGFERIWDVEEIEKIKEENAAKTETDTKEDTESKSESESESKKVDPKNLDPGLLDKLANIKLPFMEFGHSFR